MMVVAVIGNTARRFLIQEESKARVSQLCKHGAVAVVGDVSTSLVMMVVADIGKTMCPHSVSPPFFNTYIIV